MKHGIGVLMCALALGMVACGSSGPISAGPTTSTAVHRSTTTQDPSTATTTTASSTPPQTATTTTTALPTTTAAPTTAPPPTATTLAVPTTPKEVVVAFVRAWFDGDEAAMQQLASAEAIASFHPTPSPATAWTVEDCAEVAQGWACNVHLYEDRDDHVATIGWYEAHVVPDDSGVRIEQLSESL